MKSVSETCPFRRTRILLPAAGHKLSHTMQSCCCHWAPGRMVQHLQQLGLQRRIQCQIQALFSNRRNENKQTSFKVAGKKTYKNKQASLFIVVTLVKAWVCPLLPSLGGTGFLQRQPAPPSHGSYSLVGSLPPVFCSGDMGISVQVTFLHHFTNTHSSSASS